MAKKYPKECERSRWKVVWTKEDNSEAVLGYFDMDSTFDKCEPVMRITNPDPARVDEFDFREAVSRIQEVLNFTRGLPTSYFRDRAKLMKEERQTYG